MSMFIGFKRLRIQPLGNDLKASGDQIVVQGDPNKGATIKAEVSGISKDPTVVSGSNVGYYTSRKGVGTPKVEFDLLDVPLDSETTILGREKSETGVQYTGENSEAPYCAITLESEDGQGNTALVGFFYGVFSKDKETMNTKEQGETFKPDADSYTFTASGSKQADTNGKYMAKYAGDSAAAISELYKSVLLSDPTNASDGSQSTPTNQG